MQSPDCVQKKLGNPDHFHDKNLYCGTLDNGGVHKNANVPDKAMYLIAMGGYFNGCKIEPMAPEGDTAIAMVEALWYRAITAYFTTTESFNQAYYGIIQACDDLYSADQCAEVTKALQAVELNQPGRCSGRPESKPACSVPCLSGRTTKCGPADFVDNGTPYCRFGTQTCIGGVWGPCAGAIYPDPDIGCVDADCNGTVRDTCG